GFQRGAALGSLAVAGVAAFYLAGTLPGIEDVIANPKEIRRDYEATSIALGAGKERQLIINGVGITFLTPVTKMMAHLPLAYLDRPPQRVLVIAFGMGTSFRSAMSW